MTRLDTVKELTDLGLNQREIAERLGLKSRRQVARLQVRAGIPPKPRRVLTEEEKARIKYLSEEEGWPPSEISETLGIKYTTVYRYTAPSTEWRDTAAYLSQKYNSLWRELQRGKDSA